MRHGKDTFKIGRTGSHNRCLMANMLKSLVEHERIETTVVKAKELRRYADRLVTWAKENTLAARRRAIATMMVRYNTLTPAQAKVLKEKKSSLDLGFCNGDRKVIEKLFGHIGPRFAGRNGGYTRIIKKDNRVGDNAQTCYIEYLAE